MNESKAERKSNKPTGMDRAKVIAGFDQMPNEALASVAVIAVVQGDGESTTWRRMKNDPAHPKPIKLSSRCTRLRVGDMRAYWAAKGGVQA